MNKRLLTGGMGFLVLAALAGCGEAAAGETPTAAADAAAVPTPEPQLPAATATQAADWKVVLRTERVGAESPLVAGFVDEQHGIVAGVNGEIHYTLDGGASWPDAQNTSACRFGLDIVDGQLAWTVGNNGQVRVSKDGGETWLPVADVPGRSNMAAFVDDTTGWVAGVTKLSATDDGGLTWTGLALPEAMGKIAAIGLLPGGRGYLVDSKGILYATADGGETWTGITLGLEKDIFVGDSLPLAALRFTDPENGVVIVSLEYSGGTLIALRTADGGETWTEESLPVKLGALFLTHDGALLTVLDGNGRVTLLSPA
ncbi:MAG: WD40/YVTN/BNR-like repeat-containing protein [Anaerolineales bacterium]